ncbi:MAG TPA: class I SAM-dependent methyltransferase [Chryseolinea sp.]|nr:class I SAM-dependent methyltransferase [Chryseolinea sp.]
MQVKQFDQQYSKYYNLLYADKNYDNEVQYVDKLLKLYRPGAKTVLEYGSGTGGHGILLNKLGYNVFGLERSSEMAEVARSRGLACEVADIVNFNLEKTFDACISLFHVMSYINDNDGLIKVFTNTKKHLAKNGIFIFDVWFTPAVLHQIPETRVKKIENDEIEVLRIATPAIDDVRNIVGVNYHILIRDKFTGQYEEFKETHNMRHFGVPEIELLANQTGFALVKAEEFLTGNTPSGKTWGVSFILQST